MTEMDKMKQLLDELCIDWHMENYQAIVLDTVPVKIYPTLTRGCYIKGWGFSGTWTYSAEFVAKLLDRKFREEMRHDNGR